MKLAIAVRSFISLILAGYSNAPLAQTIYDPIGGIQLKPASHLYWRVGYTSIKPNNRNKDVQDVGGPVLKYGDEFTPGLAPQYAQALQLLSNNIRLDRPQDYATQGLGIPDGVTVQAKGAGGLTVSIGYYLNEERNWAAEAYALGQPFQVAANGAGRIGGKGGDAVNLGGVLRTNALGPIAYLKYIAGEKGQWLRPSIGVGGYYFVFFGTRASKALQDYSGGPTQVHIKNAYGPATFLGADLNFGDGWTLSANVGYLWLKTEATALTRTDPAMITTSPALEQAARDIGPNTLNAIQIINGSKFNTANLLPGIASALAQARSGSSQQATLGTYKRSFSATLNPWLMTVSIGKTF